MGEIIENIRMRMRLARIVVALGSLPDSFQRQAWSSRSKAYNPMSISTKIESEEKVTCCVGLTIASEGETAKS